MGSYGVFGSAGLRDRRRRGCAKPLQHHRVGTPSWCSVPLQGGVRCGRAARGAAEPHRRRGRAQRRGRHLSVRIPRPAYRPVRRLRAAAAARSDPILAPLVDDSRHANTTSTDDLREGEAESGNGGIGHSTPPVSTRAPSTRPDIGHSQTVSAYPTAAGIADNTKIQRQPRKSTHIPPSRGPNAKAVPVHPVQTPASVTVAADTPPGHAALATRPSTHRR